MPHSNIFIHLNSGLKELYLATTLRTFGMSLVGVFIPAFLIEKGLSLTNAFLFLAIYYAFFALVSPPVANLSHKIGIKHTAMMSSFLLVAFYALLVFGITKLTLGFYLVAIIGALGAMTYWIPMNSYFVQSSDLKHRSEEIAYYAAIPKLAAIGAPIIGGIIITYYGFNWLFLLGIIFIIALIEPLSKSIDHKAVLKYPWKDFIKTKKSISYIELFLIHGLLVISSAILYPFYIYVTTKNFEVTGLVTGLAALGMALFAIYAGKVADEQGKLKVIRIGAIISILTFGLLLIPTSSNLFLYALSFPLGASHMLIAIPLFSLYCDRIKENKTEYMALRDVGLNIGRVAPLLIAVFTPTTLKFPIAFLIAATASIYFVFLKL